MTGWKKSSPQISLKNVQLIFAFQIVPCGERNSSFLEFTLDFIQNKNKPNLITFFILITMKIGKIRKMFISKNIVDILI